MMRLRKLIGALIVASALILCGCTINVAINHPDSTSGESAQVSYGSSSASQGESSTYSSGTEGGGGGSSGNADGSGAVTEDGQYTDKDSVALYIHQYGHLPSNYISKSKARKAGWESEKGNLWDVLPGMSIGGSEFYNDEKLLPDADGRRWSECDIDYEGGYRNAKRIVFSNDGLVFYTGDHYKTFEQLY